VGADDILLGEGATDCGTDSIAHPTTAGHTADVLVELVDFPEAGRTSRRGCRRQSPTDRRSRLRASLRGRPTLSVTPGRGPWPPVATPHAGSCVRSPTSRTASRRALSGSSGRHRPPRPYLLTSRRRTDAADPSD
jgi:hypothetical protein